MFLFDSLLKHSWHVFLNILLIKAFIFVLRIGPRMFRKKVRQVFKKIGNSMKEKEEEAAK